MRLSVPALLLALTLGSQAFPTLDHLTRLSEGQAGGLTQEQLDALAETMLGSLNEGLVAHAEGKNSKRAIFDAASQLIDVSGTHAFVAPGANDVRGPCPGLNALANHGYLPHSGVASLIDYAAAVNKVYNMGSDLGTALAAFGTSFAGNMISLNPGFSMGGKTSNSQSLLGNVLGLLGEPVGLSGTHGQYEQDASGTRGDTYVTGDNSVLQMSLFMDLYNLQINATDPNYSMDVMLQHNINRYYQSLNTNPYFWYGPLGGTVLRNAAYCFTGRLFANYSAQYPLEGRISKDTLKSFFAITGPEGAFVYNQGGERIPKGFYRRPTPYGFVETAVDLAAWFAKYPVLLNAGGNTGKVSSFVGIDITNLTGGILNAGNLLQSNNAICFALELLIEFSPSLLHSLYSTITVPLQSITNTIGLTITSLNCPQLVTATNGGTDILAAWKTLYPGVQKAGNAI